jgi:hypothetical protein
VISWFILVSREFGAEKRRNPHSWKQRRDAARDR